jgi:glutaconate CoA-transferase subunit A
MSIVPSSVGRDQVVIGEAEAAGWIESGMTVAIGGFILSSHPMAIIRGIIRRGVRDLTVIGAASAGLEIDLLIGAGCVKKLITAYVGGEAVAPIGPLFKVAVEAGTIDLWECDESIFYAGLRAGAQGLPSMPVFGLQGTSYPDLNPDLVPYADPVTGQPVIAVPAIRADVAILHAAQADHFGNVQFVGTGFGDRALYNAADRTLVQVEKIVPVEETRRNPAATAIPYAHGIVKAPYGSHPFASPGFYLEDSVHLAEYVAAARGFARSRDRGELDGYLARYVTDPATHEDYLDAIGIRRLLSLSEY